MSPSPEIFKKIRRLEIKVRRLVENTFAGEYHSAFKGQGLEFEDVRPYQYGDDIRTIDWNVTAKTGEVFIKTFREEREQTLFVLFDVSGSKDFGQGTSNKRLIGTEIAAILAFSALQNNDKIGLATFSDHIERYYRPQKGRKHVLALVRSLLTAEPASRHTRIAEAVQTLHRLLKRRSVILVVSDFLDQDYQNALLRLHRKHEVILIRLFHPDETFRQSVGTVPVRDLETERISWLHVGDTGYRKKLVSAFRDIDRELQAFSRRYGLGYLSVNTQQDYLPVLARFFRQRTR